MENRLLVINKHDNVLFRDENGKTLRLNHKLSDVDSVAVSLPKGYTEMLKEINMTPEEKDEFDKLKKSFTSLSVAFEAIVEDEDELLYSNLYSKLFDNSNMGEDNTAQIEFARAWNNPSLIVVKEKYYTVRVPNTKEMFYYKDSDNDLRCGTEGNEPGFKFTADELVHYNFDLPLYKKEEVEL